MGKYVRQADRALVQRRLALESGKTKMIGYRPISDMQRVVRIEAESGMATSPVRPDKRRPPRQSIVTATRLALTVALRRLADALEPAARCGDRTPAADVRSG